VETWEESARVETTKVENTGGECSKYEKAILFWLDKMTVALSYSFINYHHLCANVSFQSNVLQGHSWQM